MIITQKLEETHKEITKNESILCDYNLTIDKMKSQTRTVDIQNIEEYLRQQNMSM